MNTIDEAIAVLQAMKEGKEIQYCPGLQHEWTVLRKDQNIYSVLTAFKCRVKPEPRVFWVNVLPSDESAHVCFTNEETAKQSSGDYGEIVEVIEVIK